MNNTSYSLEIKNKVNIIAEKYDDTAEFIQYSQFITKKYLLESDTRGLLIYFATGVGKSILASSISDYYRKHEKNKKIIILLSKSLQSNFENNIRKYMKNNPENDELEKSNDYINRIINNKYKFISLNSSNMYEQITKITKTKSEIELEKKLGVFTESVGGVLENSLLIIDEFHNLSNAITNGSKNAVKLYNMIMNTRNIKLVFLTGTPIINSPFELVPTFNLLKGYIFDGKTKYTLFPENRDEFEKFFLHDRKNIKNKSKFQNRIIGMVSYYGEYYFKNTGRSKEFPVQKTLIMERVPMSLSQFGRYKEVRDIELEESGFSKQNSELYFSFKSDQVSNSTYRIRSRQVSNYFIPEYALTFKNSRRSVTKHLKKIKHSDLINIPEFSPKFDKVIKNINKYKNQLGFVYSEFVSGEGLILFSMILETRGYIFWEKSKNYASKNGGLEINEGETPHYHEKTYALITGDVIFSERQHIINIFNSPENINGSLISLLLISKSGAEGLNLYNIRHIHIIEPFWNYARIEQIIARGVRYQSHKNLPVGERNVQPYIYISTYPKNFDKDLIKERTTDEEILFSALNGKKLRDEFELALIETSIDCSIHSKKYNENLQENDEKLECYLCAPTGVKLYDPDIYIDINNPNPCQKVLHKIKDEGVKLKEIVIDINGNSETFYYSKEKDIIKIFRYSSDLGGYIRLKKSSPIYADIVRKLLFD